MTPFLSYLLKANLVLLLLYGFYYLCLRRDTFYGYIRWYLLAAIAAGVLFPLADISPWLVRNSSMVPVSQYISGTETVYHYVMAQGGYMAATATPATILPVGLTVFWCWLPIAVFLLGKRLYQFASLICLGYRFPRKYHGIHAIIAINRDMQPFSFFSHIFLNPSLYTEEELDEIIVHEQVHCRNKHTVDILLAETVVCLCWFNPAAWLLRNDLKINLEYYTDRKTLRSGFDRKHYQYSLLRASGSAYRIVNHFQFNHLKKRIIMMNRKESSRILSVKYLLTVPALAAALLTVHIPSLQAAGGKDGATEQVQVTPDATTAEKEQSPLITYTVNIQPSLINPDGERNAAQITPDATTAEKEQTPLITYTVNIQPSLTNPDGERNAAQVTPDATIAEKKPAPWVIILDGERITSDRFNTVDREIIESFKILRDASAKAKYGEEGSAGVFIITTKKNAEIKTPDLPETVTPDSTTAKKEPAEFYITCCCEENLPQPLIILDGERVPRDRLNTVDPEIIESFKVLKDASAKAKYGEEGSAGVVIITTKKNAEIKTPDLPEQENNGAIPVYYIRQGTMPGAVRDNETSTISQ